MKQLLYLKDNQLKEFIEKLFVSYRETFADTKKILDKHKLGIAHQKVLHLISQYHGITISELLSKLKVTKQSLNRVLRSLLKEKFIIQKMNADDGRKKNLYLTDTAKDKLNNVIKPLIDRLSKSYVKSGANAVQGFNMVVNSLIEKNNE